MLHCTGVFVPTGGQAVIESPARKFSDIGNVITSDIIETGESAVREKDGHYEGRFSIKIGEKRIGALYFEAALTVGNSSQQ